MDKKSFKHSDCRNFAAVDVVKGICRRKNELVFIDTDVCSKFEVVPKCKSCANFAKPDKDDIGNCTCSKVGYWTFGENFALNCEGYQVK